MKSDAVPSLFLHFSPIKADRSEIHLNLFNEPKRCAKIKYTALLHTALSAGQALGLHSNSTEPERSEVLLTLLNEPEPFLNVEPTRTKQLLHAESVSQTSAFYRNILHHSNCIIGAFRITLYMIFNIQYNDKITQKYKIIDILINNSRNAKSLKVPFKYSYWLKTT